MWTAGLAIIFAAAVTACAPGQRGGTADGGAGLAKALQTNLRAEPGEFRLSQHRDVRIVFSLVNTSRQVLRLDFPTEQHLEVAVKGSGGQRLFLWSEDRSFAALASSVVVNPGERLEYEAGVPTRDMAAGGVYTVEAVLPGYPQTESSITLRPQ